jgi:hypothetical protein
MQFLIITRYVGLCIVLGEVYDAVTDGFLRPMAGLRIHNLTISTINGVRVRGETFSLRTTMKSKINLVLARCRDKFRSGR